MVEVGVLGSMIRKVGLFEIVELPICVAAVALAFAYPRIGASAFGGIERGLKRIATRPYASMVLIAALALACRVILIPFMQVDPLIPDETSLRLQADTYLHGRLGNPAVYSPDMTAIYTLLKPSYASIYPVLRSLPLFIGELLFSNLWIGVWLTVILMCVTTYWALRAYVSPAYALIAALIVVLRFAVFNFWVNSYFGPTLTAIGGLLLLGGYARLIRKPTLGSAFSVGAGAFFLMTTRPFEGMIFSLPLAIGLLVHFLRSPEQRRSLLMPGMVAASLVLAGLALTVIHNQAVTGDWKKAPYTLYREESGGSPAFLFDAPLAPRDPVLYQPEHDTFDNEAINYAHGKSLGGVASVEASRFEQFWNFYIGVALTVPFLIGLFDLRRHVAVLMALAILAVGLSFETFDWAHYASPALGVVMVSVALGLQRLRLCALGGRAIGVSLSRLLPLAIVAGLALPVVSVLNMNAKLELPRLVSSSCCWIPRGNVHAAVERALARSGDRKFVVVDTGPRSPPYQWIVYNDADPGGSAMIWLNEDARLNPRTFTRYPGRTIWHLGWTPLGSVCVQPGARGFGPALPELRTSRYDGEWRRPSDDEISRGCLRI